MKVNDTLLHRLDELEKCQRHGLHTATAILSVLLLEEILRRLYREGVRLLPAHEQFSALDVEKKIGKGHRVVDRFDLGELVGLYHESKFFAVWGRATSRPTHLLEMLQLEKLRGWRNRLVHEGAIANEDEASLLASWVQSIVRTCDLARETPDPEPIPRNVGTPAPRASVGRRPKRVAPTRPEVQPLDVAGATPPLGESKAKAGKPLPPAATQTQGAGREGKVSEERPPPSSSSRAVRPTQEEAEGACPASVGGSTPVSSAAAQRGNLVDSLLSRLRRLEPSVYTPTSKTAGGAPIRLTRALFIDPYLVTQDLFESFSEANRSEFRAPKRPVERVSWFEAVQFCNALSSFVGLESAYTSEKEPRLIAEATGFRLPTEAEWEYACAGGGLPPEPLRKFAWYMGNTHGATEDVGQLAPSGSGLYDVLGNVWEWCNDWYASKPRLFGADPLGPAKGEDKVCRGGSWANPDLQVTVAARHKKDPRFRANNIGFRIVTNTSFGSDNDKQRG